MNDREKFMYEKGKTDIMAALIKTDKSTTRR